MTIRDAASGLVLLCLLAFFVAYHVVVGADGRPDA